MKYFLGLCVLFLAASSQAHESKLGAEKVCGVSGIPFSNVMNAVEDSNPRVVKAGLQAQNGKVSTCDLGDGLALAVVMPDGSKWAMLFN